MAYKIINVSTKPNVSVPDFDVWLSTVPESVIAAFPDAAGKTPVQVIEESVAALDDPANGFISQGSVPSDSNLIWTWESIWTSQADWSNAVTTHCLISGNIETAGSYLRRLYQTENGITVEAFFSNI